MEVYINQVLLERSRIESFVSFVEMLAASFRFSVFTSGIRHNRVEEKDEVDLLDNSIYWTRKGSRLCNIL